MVKLLQAIERQRGWRHGEAASLTAAQLDQIGHPEQDALEGAGVSTESKVRQDTERFERMASAALKRSGGRPVSLAAVFSGR